ncbi:MAG: DUF6754 domain-containing protein [Myxococcota bacterium]|nr:DUF6754 domain-containing protein [Myxococcota bacterium]
MMKTLFRTCILFMSLLSTAATAAPIDNLTIVPPKASSGLNLSLSWTFGEATTSGPEVLGLRLLRRLPSETEWTLVGEPLAPDTTATSDTVPETGTWAYKLVSVYTDTPEIPKPEALSEDASEEEQASFDAEAAQLRTAWVQTVIERSDALGDDSDMATGTTKASWLNTNPGHLLLLALIALVGGLMMVYTRRAQRGEEIYIRRIPGIDAIEEGIGRATEMGKPVLYVPGIDDLQDIQTIASMLILGQVSKTVAEYQSDLIVSCCIPIVREVADEVVKAGYFQAGHPDAYNASNIRFISSEQFAFCAGTNGIMLREKPATNIYFGRFFAESLILAETGFVNRSIQIAGTAEATQLPFFVAACDYTLIGEELFAVSAYLSKDPRLVSSLKASDIVKVLCVAALLLGTVLHSMGNTFLVDLFKISG